MLVPGQPNERQQLAGARGRLRGRHAVHAQPERDVADHVAMREERVVLEHQAQLPAVRRDAREVVAVPHDAAAHGRLEPGDGAEQRALAAAAGTENRHDFAVFDDEVDAVERDGVAVADFERLDPQHQNSPMSAKRKRSMAKIAAAVTAIRMTLAAMAAPKFNGPGWPSRRKMTTGSVG